MKIIPFPKDIKLTNNSSRIDNIEKIIDNSISKEGYKLVIKDNNAQIFYSTDAGLFYGECTLKQIKECDMIVECTIDDEPKYEYRGFMIDCARHYFSIDEIKKIIDSMALLKFNKFHWHLTDDQGWRIDSKKYPQLNEKAAIRPYSNFGKRVDNEPYGIVYTAQEMRDIVKFCKERYIDVIPEFDTPGHTSALLSAFSELSCNSENVEIKTRQGIYKDVICPASDKVFEIVFNILDEMCDIFPYDTFHIGGDEAPSKHWESCPKCQALMKENNITDYADYQCYYMNKIIDYLKTKGKKCIAWNDAVKGNGLNKNCTIQYWKEHDRNSINYVNNGGKMVLSPFSYYYMDYDYDITSMKHTYSFSPNLKGLNNNGASNIIGLEAPIWTEYIDNNKRLEEMLFPRVFAVSEAAWGKNSKSYNEFLNNIDNAEKLVKEKGISFMDKNKWSLPHATLVKGWLRFVFNNYSIDYIKSCLK